LTLARGVAPKIIQGRVIMKTTPLLKSGRVGRRSHTLLANPLWACGGGAHSYDRNQAGQQRIHGSTGQQLGTTGRASKFEQALKDKGFEAGSLDGVMDSQTQSAISQFQTDNNLPATGTVDAQTAKQLGVEIMPSIVAKENRWT
jgi:hypothetical protein